MLSKSIQSTLDPHQTNLARHEVRRHQVRCGQIAPSKHPTLPDHNEPNSRHHRDHRKGHNSTDAEVTPHLRNTAGMGSSCVHDDSIVCTTNTARKRKRKEGRQLQHTLLVQHLRQRVHEPSERRPVFLLKLPASHQHIVSVQQQR